MNVRRTAVLVLCAMAVLLTTRSQPTLAAPPGPQTSHLYLKLSDIAGSSTDDSHTGEIDVLSFNWSANHNGAKVEMHDALVLKPIDVATPKLMAACASSAKIPQAVLTARGSVGGKEGEFLVYTFSDVVITVVSHTVINGAQEQVQFRYGSVKISFKSPDGKTVEETWKADEK